MSSTGSALTDEDLATVLEGKARALRDDETDREDAVRGILRLLGDEPGVVEREQVYEDGRTSFGRKHAGEGIALFLPDDVGERGEA